MSTRIFLADDHSIVRDGIRSLLEKQPDLTVIGEADNGRDAVQQITRLRPDVVVMDIAMPKLNGIEAARQLISALPGLRIIILSMHSDKRFVTEVLKTGAVGYLQKSCAFKHLVAAIRAVCDGHVYMSPEITGIVVDSFRRQKLAAAAREPALSPKEREVLQLLAEGQSSKEIADCLKVSGKTVDTHRQHIMDKLGLHSIAELTKYAIREGITSVER
jgi:DNA-binding NarL/FixJ family response regulator